MAQELTTLTSAWKPITEKNDQKVETAKYDEIEMKEDKDVEEKIARSKAGDKMKNESQVKLYEDKMDDEKEHKDVDHKNLHCNIQTIDMTSDNNVFLILLLLTN